MQKEKKKAIDSKLKKGIHVGRNNSHVLLELKTESNEMDKYIYRFTIVILLLWLGICFPYWISKPLMAH